MYIPPELKCTSHLLPLSPGATKGSEASALECAEGCRVPVVGGIPRFVDSSNYANSFGLQWKAFQKTQLDSYTGLPISHNRLIRCLGGSLEVVRGKSVLEVGCGAGRFTEILLSAGARVFACDLSVAVEANRANCSGEARYFVCQADVRRLPSAPFSFDVVLCIGVIQHTPNPEETISALASQVKPGGLLVIDHYARDYPVNLSRRVLRSLLLRLPPATSKSVAIALSRSLLPLHKIFWSERRGVWRIRRMLRKLSPLIDYYDAYPQLGPKLLSEWAILDTHDTLTDYYKHLRSVEEIRDCLVSCGLTEIEVYHGGNGIEARARRPMGQAMATGN